MTPSRKSKHNIKRIKPPFCGEPFLNDLISAVEKIYTVGWKKDYRIERDKALISALFLTGARPSEVVRLRRNSFDFDNEEAKRNNAFLVKEFALMKHGTEEQRAHVTRKFPIWRDDPLVDILIEWHDEVDDYLFPSPFKKGKPHLSYFHANALAKKVGEHLPTPHYIFPVWFRRQREFHLAETRGFTMSNIMAYMGLNRIQETPTKRKDWQNLLVIARDFQQKMLPKKFQEHVNPLIELLPMTDFLDIDTNWMLSVIALQLQEIAIQKISDK